MCRDMANTINAATRPNLGTLSLLRAGYENQTPAASFAPCDAPAKPSADRWIASLVCRTSPAALDCVLAAHSRAQTKRAERTQAAAIRNSHETHKPASVSAPTNARNSIAA